MEATSYGPEIGAPFAPNTSAEGKIRNLVASVLKRCPKDRARVASELTALSGIKVTKRMIDDWCSPSRKGLRFPLSLVKAVCDVTGTDDLAFLAMRDSLRECAQLGARAVELRQLLADMTEKAGRFAGSPKRARATKRSKRGK